MTIRTGILVHGPPGSGKATAIRAAATALGLHVVPYGCAGLHAGGQGPTASRLRAAHEAACRYAPTVLQLTNLEALAGSAAEEASSPGQLMQDRAGLVRKWQACLV